MSILESRTIEQNAELALTAANKAAIVADQHRSDCMGGFVNDCATHGATWNLYRRQFDHDMGRVEYIMTHGLRVVGH